MTAHKCSWVPSGEVVKGPGPGARDQAEAVSAEGEVPKDRLWKALDRFVSSSGARMVEFVMGGEPNESDCGRTERDIPCSMQQMLRCFTDVHRPSAI